MAERDRRRRRKRRGKSESLRKRIACAWETLLMHIELRTAAQRRHHPKSQHRQVEAAPLERTEFRPRRALRLLGVGRPRVGTGLATSAIGTWLYVVGWLAPLPGRVCMYAGREGN